MGCCYSFFYILRYWIATVDLYIWTNALMQLGVSISVYIPGQFYSFKFAPWFQTAGIGVFAGRAFKKDEIVLRSWMTLYLPRNFPRGQTPRYYVFSHNKTHMAWDLDYGSIINHHESANARAAGADNMHYRVRRFSMCESSCSKNMQHAYEYR